MNKCIFSGYITSVSPLYKSNFGFYRKFILSIDSLSQVRNVVCRPRQSAFGMSTKVHVGDYAEIEGSFDCVESMNDNEEKYPVILTGMIYLPFHKSRGFGKKEFDDDMKMTIENMFSIKDE